MLSPSGTIELSTALSQVVLPTPVRAELVVKEPKYGLAVVSKTLTVEEPETTPLAVEEPEFSSDARAT